MTPYEQLLNELRSHADEAYRAFHGRLLANDKLQLIGVRIPVLRAIAKGYKPRVREMLSWPDEYYEVTFVKLQAAAMLPFGEFLQVVDGCVARIDNWASCDCFKAKCIAKHREEFLPDIEKYLSDGREYYQRYALTTLLAFYVEEDYLPYIFDCILRADTGKYYVHMAAAWLLAEILVKNYERGVAFLQSGASDARTHNKAISKAVESYRITAAQKTYLKSLKR